MTQTATHNQSLQDDCLFCMDHLYEAALGILEQEDRPRLEHHLAECDVCRAELAELDATVGLLPLAVKQVEPRPEARHKLLNRMNTELQSPRIGTPVAKVTSNPTTKSIAGRRPMWAMGSVFAGLCVALVAIAIWNLLPFGSGDNTMPEGQIRVLAMESSNCEDCGEDTGGHIGADPEQNDGMVIAWNLDPNEKHEVWCVNRDGERRMVGELEVDSTGTVMQTVSFPEAVGAYDQIYVARNDGTEELTVAPSKLKPNNDPPATPPE